MSRRCFWNKQVKATGERIKPISQNSARRGLAAETGSLFCIIFENIQTATFPSESLHGPCLSQCCRVYRLSKLTSRTSDPLYQTRKHDLNSCLFFFSFQGGGRAASQVKQTEGFCTSEPLKIFHNSVSQSVIKAIVVFF